MSNYSPEIGLSLSEELLPISIKTLMLQWRKLVLLLDHGTARLPWELLQISDGETASPLAIQVGIIRRLDSYRQRGPERQIVAPTALVVGMSSNVLSQPPTLAAEEAVRAVRTRLADAGYDIQFLAGNDANERMAVPPPTDRPWRIVHIAAGAMKGETRGRWLEDGPSLRVFLLELRPLPDLVFLDCGYVSSRSGRPSTSAGVETVAHSVGLELIDRGAGAVITTGFGVDDRFAGRFANEFYRHMLAGTQFGDAVTRTRTAMYAENPDSIAWRAYQCYGHPAFSLTSAGREER